MKIARFFKDGDVRYGAVSGDEIVMIEEGEEAEFDDKKGILLSDVLLLAPTAPSKIVAVGLNYIDHAKELNMEIPKEPLLFLKPSTSVIGPDEDIIIPNISKRVDYEGELAIVVGKEARDVPVSEAKEYIFGYTCLNDVTARDLQALDVQFTRAKSFDTFCPIGPWVETELDSSDLKIETKLNGDVVQSSRTSMLSFGPLELLSFISGVMTLLPGDVIATGTPAGIGQIEAGDIVEVTIEGIGTLKNMAVAK
jgi:2-keto-4-pentenoate hydratase/2-oxohepta-3-ene-1,7-dioic acid hydratase in catechol pathway